MSLVKLFQIKEDQNGSQTVEYLTFDNEGARVLPSRSAPGVEKQDLEALFTSVTAPVTTSAPFAPPPSPAPPAPPAVAKKELPPEPAKVKDEVKSHKK